MSCPIAQDVMLLDSGRFPAEVARKLERHAGECDECTYWLGRLRASARVARGHRVAVDPRARVEIWERLGAGAEPVRGPWTIGWAAAGVVAVALLLAVWLIPRPMAVSHARLEVSEERTGFAIEDDGASVVVAIERGSLRADVDPLEAGESFEVRTPEARINVVGTVFSVACRADGTEIDVFEGSVMIWPKGEALPVRLGASGRLVVPAGPVRAKVAPAVSPVQVEPELPKPVAAKPVALSHERSKKREPPVSEPPKVVDVPPEKPAPDLVPALTLQDAREALPRDARRAAEIAKHIADKEPTAQIGAEALAVQADAERRAGMLKEAAESYARLRDHPHGHPFAEEAMLQRAMLLVDLGRRNTAEQELHRLEAAFPRGASAPERVALQARLARERGDIRGALEIIDRAHVEGSSVQLDKERRAVERALEKE